MLLRITVQHWNTEEWRLFNRSDLERKLQQGIDAARRGDRTAARDLLEEIIDADPNNELAWMWLASTVTTLSDRRDALEKVLEINPGNNRAREALRQLELRTNPTAGPTPAAAPRRTTASRASQASGSTNLILIGLAATVGLAILAILAAIQGGGDTTPAPAQPAAGSGGAAVAAANTPDVPTNTPLPPPATATRFVVPLDQVATRVLPPSFTPTNTATATATPTPTSTPFPLAEFQVYFTSLETGREQPYLYTMVGDGQGQAEVGQGFRDVAIDPAGERIAFVRDVNYGSAPVGGGETTPEATDQASPAAGLFPELFVAPVGNLSAAVQLTTLRSSILASPSWGPEGRELVFVSNVDGDEDLWYITPDGQNLINITNNFNAIDRDPTWSPIPGSRQIVFASDLDTPLQTELYSIVFIEPGEPLDYVRLTNATGSSWAPEWSANGSLIAFVSDRGGDPDIYVMSADGRGQTLLTKDDGDAEDRSPAFTPDARFVVFISNRLDDRFQSYLVSLDGNVLTRLTTSDRNDQSIVYRPNLLARLQSESAP